MGQILSDLSYNTKTLKPIGRPVDDLKALYKDKADDYNYVIDSLNATETALNQVSFIDKDKHVVDRANNKYQETFAQFSEEGDFENKIVDTKRLANDLTNKYGLLRVQTNSKVRTDYMEGLQEKVDKGEMSSERMGQLMQYSDKHYKGVTKSDVTGGYTGTYEGRLAQPQIDVSKEVLIAMNGFKSNKFSYNGGFLVRDPNGKGYLMAGTREEVTEEDIRAAAKAHVRSNGLIQSQFNEDVFLELDAIGELTTEKVREVLKGRTNSEIASLLGITDNRLPSTSELENIIKEKNLTNEEVFSIVRKEQIMDEAVEAAVVKESFVKEETKYLKDWQQEYGLKNKPLETQEYEILNIYDNVQNISSDDVKKTAKVLEESKDNLAKLKNDLINLKGSADANAKAITLDKIQRQQLTINDIEEQQALIFDNVDMNKMFEEYEGIDKAIGSKMVDIPKGELRKLVYAEMNGTLTDEEVLESLTDVYSIEEFNNQKDKGDISVAFSDNYKEYTDKKVATAKGRIRHATNYFEKQLDKNDKDYVTQYNTLLFSKMPLKAQIAHPLYGNWQMVEDMYSDNSTFYMGMKSVHGGVDLKTQIEEAYGLGSESEKKGDIKWETSKVSPTLDYRPDISTGEYRPALTVQVDIVKDRQGTREITERVNMPVFLDNPNYEKRFKENLVKYRERLVNKAKQGTLSEADRDILDRTNLSLYNSTKYSRDIDLKNLHNIGNADTPIRINENLTRNVKSYSNNSPTGQSFYITEGSGDNAIFLGFDNKGNVVRLSENEMRSNETVQKIRNGNLKMLGGDTVTALKTQFADMTLSMQDANIGKPIEDIPLKDIANDEKIRLANNNFESTKINEVIYDDVVDLFKAYPNILATDISRNPTTNVEGSAVDSTHKTNHGARSIDIRANDNSQASVEAKKIHALSDREKTKKGIEKTILHGEGNNLHVHIKFII